ncbi:hypothetical protein [Vagococcus salmoninarum]|uniref:hypothetical protein n=1 Tax=Vagococcus salmoninarum TaxID=2739 RepID=UPI000F87F675|nr:hypothetical protein [Vagococcus salmoninarum]MBE9390292.1 hypothetical protein [Vagococcus salmoninarum]
MEKLDKSVVITSPIVFCSFMIMNNLCNILKVQRSEKNDEFEVKEFNVSNIYSKVFNNLICPSKLMEFHFEKGGIIEIYSNTDDEDKINNLKESFINLIEPSIKLLEREGIFDKRITRYAKFQYKKDKRNEKRFARR